MTLFSTHGILHSTFVQQQLQSAHAATRTPMQELHDVLAVEASQFGPQAAYWMMASKRGAGHAQRMNASALFATGPTVTMGQVRTAFPRLTDDKRREAMKEFANFQAASQTWLIKAGMP